MQWIVIPFALLHIVHVNADVYLHIPRGSNNRLDDDDRDRKTDNRLFDSQNNDRGGYNVGGDKDRSDDLKDRWSQSKKIRDHPGIRAYIENRDAPLGKMKYYEDSILQVSWTNQHQCGQANTHCELILQYMCDENLRDGHEDKRIKDVNSCEKSEDGEQKYCDTDRRYGMHEDTWYYTTCLNTKRNEGLFTADQTFDSDEDTAQYTRQNSNGDRYGYECPEERDYYPYWRPTPWKDIAIMTSDTSRCADYISESENRKARFYCKIKESVMEKSRKNDGEGEKDERIPITEKECKDEKFDGTRGEWKIDPTWKEIEAPDCILSPKSRDNHNGNGPSGFPNNYNWTIPKRPHANCALRLRYNISTADFDRSTDSSSNAPNDGDATTLDISALIGGTIGQAEAIKRGFVFEGNPEVRPFQGDDEESENKLELELNINTAQYGRTFEDRSHAFSILVRPTDLEDEKIYNMEVQGKRGNIVQVYPAVEYDFGPNRLEVETGDYIHLQWTGSDENPGNNDGNGKAGSDRSNMALLKAQNYPEGPNKRSSETGHFGNSYPAKIDYSSKLLGLQSATTRRYMAYTVEKKKDDDKSLAPTNVFSVRQGKRKTLECDDGLVLNIRSATYGKMTNNGCSYSGADKAVKDECDKKEKCSLKATSSLFDRANPCSGVTKEIVVNYTCVIPDDADDVDLADLDAAHPYFNLYPQKLTETGIYQYMCTRNNDFSNRSHKGRVTVVGSLRDEKPEDEEVKDDKVKENKVKEEEVMDEKVEDVLSETSDALAVLENFFQERGFQRS